MQASGLPADQLSVKDLVKVLGEKISFVFIHFVLILVLQFRGIYKLSCQDLNSEELTFSCV